MEDIYIVAAKRTPIGKFQGGLKNVSAPKLGALTIERALKESNIDFNLVDECIMGQVLTAGVGQAPARQSGIYAGLPNSTRALTVGKVCGSGLKSVTLGASSILLNHAQVVVCGGQENMSASPYLAVGAREGLRMGHKQLIDSMVNDGLWDPYNDLHMGSCGELCAKEFNISRQAQDDFTTVSYTRARMATEKGFFKDQLVPVSTNQGKTSVQISADEEPFSMDLSKISALRPVFDKDGTITAANASKVNDGASSVVLASKEFVKKNNLKPMARIVSWGEFAQEPKMFTTAPIGAMENALKRAQLSTKEIGLFEINEAFAVVVLAAMKEMNLPHSKVNIHGGACALGHPIGASGARVLTTLLYALRDNNQRYGVASLCIGGGEGIALVVENMMI